MFNFTVTRESKSPQNRFKEYLEETKEEIYRLESSFNNDNEDLYLAGFSEHESSEKTSQKDNVYSSIISRINDYSEPILIKKDIIKKGDVVSKYYYLYPDFPDMIFIRTAFKDSEENRYRWSITKDILKIHLNGGNNLTKLAIINQDISDGTEVSIVQV